MKRPGSEVQSTRIRRIAKQFVLLPLALLTAPGRWAKGLLFRFQLKSARELRAFDQLRQSRVRRDLRGLPPDHLAEPARTASGAS
jgi:hypothetical protein